MIKLKKKPKPTILVNNEADWVDKYLKLLDGDVTIPSSIKTKYSHKQIKQVLLDETNSKCCYCESKILHIDYGDVEHLLPKSAFPEKFVEWENLSISCGKCNTNKDDYHSRSLALSNPYIDNVEKEYVFAGPIVMSKSDKASKTIRKLELNRVSLIESRSSLIFKIQPFIDSIYKTEDDDLKLMLIEDLIEYKKKDKEYSLMVKNILDLDIIDNVGS